MTVALCTVAYAANDVGCSRTIRLHAVATEKHGRPVAVGPQDISASSAGKSVRIASVSRGAAPSRRPLFPQLPANIYTNLHSAEGARESRTAVLIDVLNLPPASRERVLSNIAQSLAKAHAGQEITLYSLGRQIGSLGSLMADPAKVINHLADDHIELPESERNRITLAALRSLARQMQRLPGRKSLIWISGDFSCVFVEDENGGPCGDRTKVEQTLVGLAEAEVAIYPVNAIPLEPKKQQPRMDAFDRPIGGSGGATMSASNIPDFQQFLRSRDRGMSLFASGTAGRIMEGHGLAAVLDTAAVDAAASIEVEVQSCDATAHAADIELSSRRKDIALLFPRTSHPTMQASAESLDAVEAELEDALLNEPLEATGVALYVRRSSSEDLLEVSIDPRDLSFTPETAGVRTQFDFVVATLSGKHRALAAGITHRVSKHFSSEEYERSLQLGFPLKVAFTPDKRGAFVRVLIRDVTSGRIGTVDFQLDCCNVLK